MSSIAELAGIHCTGLYRLRSLLVDYAESPDLVKVVSAMYRASCRAEAYENVQDAHLYVFAACPSDPELLDIQVCRASTRSVLGFVRFRHTNHHLSLVFAKEGAVH